jgi:microtubule-associated protein, RP/EB family
VQALIKCKMQDNLEFLQWTKRFWDQNYPGGEYDAVARRKSVGAPAMTGGPPAAPPAASTRTSGAGPTARRGMTPNSTASRPAAARTGASGSTALQNENSQLKETVAGLERERDFYFSKLRDIELLVQNAIELDPEIEKDEDGMVKHIQAILYSTEVSVL